ncbi:MAG: hypothetical protein WD557_08010 [Dehalococcoidia bacterium]
MIRRFVARGGQPRATQSPGDESGQGLAEYGLILALIAVVCVTALQTLGLGIAGSSGFTVLPGAL